MTSAEFRTARKKMGLTQAELAKIMGMMQHAISRIEKSRQPTKHHSATMRLVILLHEHGLLDKVK